MGETSAPLQGKAAATVLTGASGHHYLALGDLRNVLAGFFAVQALSPGLYLDHAGNVDRTTLTEPSAALAAAHGAALADLAAAIRASTALRAITRGDLSGSWPSPRGLGRSARLPVGRAVLGFVVPGGKGEGGAPCGGARRGAAR